MTYEFHPLAKVFPLIEGAEFDELVADVKANGLNEVITTYEGMILDGRNRYRACIAAGIEPVTSPYIGNDPVGYVISSNLRRRHLNESQRALVAARLATLKDGQRADLIEGLPIGRASELLSVGERSVARAREVQDHGVPELVLRNGRRNTATRQRPKKRKTDGQDRVHDGTRLIEAAPHGFGALGFEQ
jgi:hypothetical protein